MGASKKMNADTAAAQPEPDKKGTLQVVLLVVLLFIGFASGGYYLGTQMNFKKMTGGDAASDSETATFGGFAESAQLKKAYWLQSSGAEHAGHVIKVFLNGQFVGKFHKPDEQIECTKFMKPGRNTISIDTKSLPVDQRSDWSGAQLRVDLKAGEKIMDGEKARFEKGETIINFSRNVTDTDDAKETKEFETLE
jgi:hypothetical protein